MGVGVVCDVGVVCGCGGCLSVGLVCDVGVVCGDVEVGVVDV